MGDALCLQGLLGDVFGNTSKPVNLTGFGANREAAHSDRAHTCIRADDAEF